MVYYTHTGKAIYAVRKEGEGMTGRIHSYETLGAADGPGLRFVLFLQGCGLRCLYCHNPDTWNPCGGRTVSAEEIVGEVVRYRNYFGRRGGFTASGGEPLLQIDFLTELFRKAKEMGINTCLDTAGQPFTRENPFFDKFVELMKYTDLVMLDIKNIDDEKHKALTGHTNANILDCARYLSDTGKDMWIRHVLVSGGVGASDDDGLLKRLADFIGSLHTVRRVEVLPYHVFGVHKWEIMGIPYPLEGVEPPTQERIANANEILNTPKYR